MLMILCCPQRGAKLTQLQSTASGKFLFHVSAGSQVKTGDKVYIGIRGGLTLHTHNSSRSHYTNITVHGAPFMAVTEFDGQGGHTYERIAVRVRNVTADPLAMCAGGKRLCQGILASNADCCALRAWGSLFELALTIQSF